MGGSWLVAAVPAAQNATSGAADKLEFYITSGKRVGIMAHFQAGKIVTSASRRLCATPRHRGPGSWWRLVAALMIG